MIYSASTNNVTLKTGLGVVQDHVWLSIGPPLSIYIYSSILYRFLSYLMLNNIQTLKSGLEVTQGQFKPVLFESSGAVSYSPSLATMALYCIVCEIKIYIGLKSWFFHSPLHPTPRLGGSPSRYCCPVWYGKTRMVGLQTIPIYYCIFKRSEVPAPATGAAGRLIVSEDWQLLVLTSDRAADDRCVFVVVTIMNAPTAMYTLR